MTLLSILAFGFLLGLRHASDPDHVVAVSAIVARNRSLGTAWLLGAFWGLGHAVTIFLVGGAIILFKVAVPPRLESGMEALVGAVLVLLGWLNMMGYRMGSLGLREHSHPHDHSDPEHSHGLLGEGEGAHLHVHLHEADMGWLRRYVRDAGTVQVLRSAVVGLIHGLAGSAAVALVVLAAIPSPTAAVLYLLVFGFGTLSGMLILSAMMALSMLYLERWWRTAERTLVFATGLLSLLFGLRVIWENAGVLRG